MLVAMRVDVLVLDHVFDLGLSAVLDAFYTANELIDVSGMAVRRFDVRVVGVRAAVTSAQGLRCRYAKRAAKRRTSWSFRQSATRCRRRSSPH
jgi:hypothetical protein